MSTVSDRFVLLGTTEYPHEKEALEFVRAEFPDTDPLHARGLVELLDPSSGGLYEIDLLVIGWGAIYLIEIKSHPGRMEGDDQAWYWTPPDEDRKVFVENPLRLANRKCKVLRSLLDRKLRRVDVRCPFVQPLIFLSAPNLENKISPVGRTAVVGRDQIIRAIKFGEFPGADPSRVQRRIDRPTMKAIKKAFDELGLRPRKGQLQVGDFVLGPVVEDGDGYQDRSAHNAHFAHMKHRARVYLVPEQTTVEQRQRLKRAAEREMQLLWSVREQPHILSAVYYGPDAPLGPTLVFEDFEGALRLDRFVQRHPDLAFEKKLEILRQVGHALAYCHRRQVFHGGLSPEAVLVREHEGKVETRLFNFQLGAGEEASATIHRTMLARNPAGAYQAPELASDPTATSSASDTFSLAALAYFLFTGQAPAEGTTELLVRLHRDHYLDPAVVDDGLPEPVVNAIIEGTRVGLGERIDDAVVWIESLVVDLEARAPVEPESSADVLEASNGDILAERFTVERVLGHGASARVLKVVDEDDRPYALKVARDEEHDARVRREGEQLQRLRHPRIVECHEILEIQGHTCLLLSLAGDSLQRHLAAEGSLDLELAGRYGEDLLDALKALEDASILHRDIKPANLGVGSINRLAKHLTLFDFSLAGAGLDDLEVGTAPYRDPFLPLRRTWDTHADRWSAAVTLHEMLTGLRPHWGAKGGSPLDPGATLHLEAERFDAAVRDRLTEFFTRALARDPKDRFSSAFEMARAWSACLSPPSQVLRREATQTSLPDPTREPPTRERRGGRIELGTVTEAEIAAITPDTQIRALPLSARAMNALDRAGLMRAEELLALPNNRLSAIRGIGNKVAREILELRDRWQRHVGERSPEPAATFHPEYTGPETYVEKLPLPEDVAWTLVDAGLRTAAAVARAPKSQVEAILARAGVDPGTVRQALAQEAQASAGATEPTTVEGWLAEVLSAASRSKKTAEHVPLLLGLEPDAATGTLSELAEQRGVPRVKLERALADAIEAWRAAPWAEALRSLCIKAVEQLGGVATLGEATLTLKSSLGHDPDAPATEVDARIAALCRVAAELGPDADGRRLQMRRTDRHRLDPQTGKPTKTTTSWTLSADEDLWVRVKRLGELADELAARSVIAASGEVERVLAEAVAESDLSVEKIGKQRLVQLAAAASQTAASSSRLELYPVGMAAERALELSAQALSGSMTEETVRTRVSARYPEAQPLPSRAEGLDRLLQRLNLRWNEAKGTFDRPETGSVTSLHSSVETLSRQQTRMPGQPASMSEEALRARDFEDTLRAVKEERKLRVWAVNPHWFPDALASLEKALGVQAIALDRLLIEKMESYVQRKGGNVRALTKADAAGPSGPRWPRLREVAEAAADELAAELFPAKQPLLMIQAGLVARYGLTRFVAAMVAASQDDESEAIVLLNAAHEGDRAEVLNGVLPVTGLLPGQVGALSREWVENRHRAATMHPS